MKVFALLLLAVVLTEGIDLEKKIFDSFDLDGNGFLTGSEMRYLLTAVGMAEVDMDKIIKGVDSNGDGQINYQEFKASYPYFVYLSELPSYVILEL